MVNQVSLNGLSTKQFDQLVEVLAEHISQRSVKVRFWVPSLVQLIFDYDQISTVLQEKQLPVIPCFSQLNFEIPIMLSAVLTGQRNSAIGYLATQTELTEEDVELEDPGELVLSELTARLALMEEKAVSDEIRHRYAIKATAKNNTFVHTEWEVVQRTSDNTKDAPPGLTYATISLTIQKPHTEFMAARPGSETITVILTAGEILEFTNALKDALEGIEQASHVGDDS